MIRRVYKSLISWLVFSSILLSSTTVFGQRARGQKTGPARQTPVKSEKKPACNGGWSGFVTFKRLLNEESDTTKKRIDSGTTRHKISRDYKYTGRINVNGADPRQPIARGQVSLTDDEKSFTRTEQKDTCFYDGKGVREQWGETNDDEITKAFGEGETQFYLNVNEAEGTYYFNFRFPEAKGTYNRETKIRRGGWCAEKNNRPEDKSAASPTKVDGEGAEIDEQKIDPKNPDVLSGTKSWDTSSATLKSFKYVVTWNFRRCPSPLELEAVEFDEHPYPSWTDWRKVDGETVDGNIVRVRARVTNYSNETKFPKLRFVEQRAKAELPDSETSISISPGESREVEYLWDTSGWAWEIGGYPASQREVKVELTEPTSPAKVLSADVLIIPRPVVLAHGLWADYTSWDGYDRFFKNAHSTSWNSYAVGADPQNGVMNTGEKGTWKKSNTIEQNAVELQKQIEAIRRSKNAWHVDAVAHSMGGLISRHYVHFLMDTVADGKPALTRLVQLGTPNEGSPCANLMGFTFWALGKPVTSLEQLRPAFMERFNRAVRDRKGTRFSVLVGNPLPQTCQSTGWGDGVVETRSAIWEIGDHRYSKSVHTDLTSQENFDYFVWRRLAVSWRGDHKPDNNYRASNAGETGEVQFVNAGFNADDASILPSDLKVDLTKEVVLPPSRPTEIEIPVKANINSGVTFIAATSVSATLVNESGKVVGRSIAGTPEAKADFRSIPIENAAVDGRWKLRLENTGTNETSAIISVWTSTAEAGPRLSLEAGKPRAAGQVPITATLTLNASPITGAAVTVQIVSEEGKVCEMRLADDGRNGDSAAGDGVYTAVTGKLGSGDYFAEARAETNGRMSTAAAGFTIGAAKPDLSVKTKAK